mgnify:CR=1 FL=1
MITRGDAMSKEITIDDKGGLFEPTNTVRTIATPLPGSPEVLDEDLSGDLATPARRRISGLDRHPFAGSRIMVVDDDQRNIFAMSVLIERGQGEVIAADGGVAAIAILRQTPDIHLVLMDIMMPSMDGYATIRAIRALDEFNAIPILAVTAKVVAGERERCMAAGANDYVPKPVNTAELIAAIGPWLRTPASTNMTAMASSLPAASSAPVLVVDDSRAKRLALIAALSPLGYPIVEADSGAAALDCVSDQNFAVILLDIRMPIMDGFETAKLIRQNPRSAVTPIIFVTANTIDEIETKDVYAQGATDLLFGPLRPNEIRAKVSVFANMFMNTERLSVRAGEAQTSVENLQLLNDKLTALARHDPLTGLRNRRALEEDLELLEARAARYGHRYCMAVLDIDCFKEYNDTYGHQAGDALLHTVATHLHVQARAGDAIYRYGGDEFLCIFPDQSLATGARAIQHMRVGLEGLAIAHEGNAGGTLTFSVGLAILEPGEAKSPGQVFKEADDALYRAKQLGRNRVEYEGMSSAST